jgi:hypothetical protein
MMQKNRQRKPGISLLRGVCGFFLAMGALFVSLYLGLLGVIALMRLKPVNDRLRLFSKRVDIFLDKVSKGRIAGSRLGSLYFNLSLLKHVGRKSGREYVTGLSAYPFGDGFVLTTPYDPNNVDWWRNVMASGKCTLIWKGQEYALEKPEIIPLSKAWTAYPLSTRLLIRAGGWKQCLWVHRQHAVSEDEVSEKDVAAR